MSRRKHWRIHQFTSSSTFAIPDDKPEIEFLLRATSTPIIEQCVVSDKRIRVTGYINIFAEYVAAVDDGTQPVTFLFYKLPFDRTIAYHRAREGMSAFLKSDITKQYMHLCNSKELVITAHIKFFGMKLARGNRPLPLHQCKPYSINFFEASNPNTYTASFCPNPDSDQPSSEQELPIP